jgi:hypothetical protein
MPRDFTGKEIRPGDIVTLHAKVVGVSGGYATVETINATPDHVPVLVFSADTRLCVKVDDHETPEAQLRRHQGLGFQ